MKGIPVFLKRGKSKLGLLVAAVLIIVITAMQISPRNDSGIDISLGYGDDDR